MSGGVNIAEFLTARLDEDEDIAKEAKGDYAQSTTSGEWTHINDHPDPDQHQRIVDAFGYTVHGDFDHDVDSDPWWTLPHIARHDPARVLREVAAKRQLLEWCAAVTEHFDWATLNQPGSLLHDPNARATNTATLAMQAMATPYADHPDYQEGWKL